jgi:hypothetical protein
MFNTTRPKAKRRIHTDHSFTRRHHNDSPRFPSTGRRPGSVRCFPVGHVLGAHQDRTRGDPGPDVRGLAIRPGIHLSLASCAALPPSVVAWLDIEANVGSPSYPRPTPLELFCLSQQRYTRTVHAAVSTSEGDRQVAELSLDVVEMHLGDDARTTFEVEVELALDGRPDDLALMVADLRDKWQLQPQLRSKFEQGLAALNGEVSL